jgi:hypothetical protein
MSTDTDDNLRLGYAELCRTYHAIDDFRTKLLGFLPVATGVGVTLLSGKDVVAGPDGVGYLPVGLFGLVITAGLFAFEIFGVTKCHAVIVAGQDLETALDLPQGQFRTRPASAWGLVNEPFAGAIIYPAAMAAWSFFAARDAWPWLQALIPTAVFILGFVGTCAYGARLTMYGPPEQPGRIARMVQRLATRRPPAGPQTPDSPPPQHLPAEEPAPTPSRTPVHSD